MAKSFKISGKKTDTKGFFHALRKIYGGKATVGEVLKKLA